MGRTDVEDAEAQGDSDVVTYDVRNGVAVVTMNRPRYRNAQNSAMTYALDFGIRPGRRR